MSEPKAVEKELNELQAAELELKRLEILEKRANLQDLQERLAERQNTRDNKMQRIKTNGLTLKQNKEKDLKVQSNCNHRKGGDGPDGIMGGMGTDPQFAVIKHRMHNNDVWVRCLRCGKTWKPPIEEDYTFDNKGVISVDGKFDSDAFGRAVREYQDAVAFPTRNVMSGGTVFQWSDQGKFYRLQMRDVNLR